MITAFTLFYLKINYITHIMCTCSAFLLERVGKGGGGGGFRPPPNFEKGGGGVVLSLNQFGKGGRGGRISLLKEGLL